MPWWRQYLEKFDDPIVRILVIAAVLALISGALKGEWIEGIAILITIFLATFIGFANEYKAAKEFDLLIKAADQTLVKVVRDGMVGEIPRRDIVVGDVVLVETGEEIPADGRLLEGISLLVDESRLTGESFPVPKEMGRAADGESAFPPDFLLKGTMVAEGYGTLEATAVGAGTEFGRTARKAGEETSGVTPLGAQLNDLSRLISLVGVLAAGLIFLVLTMRGVALGELAPSWRDLLFMGIAGTGLVVAVLPMWVPMLYDGLSYAGMEVCATGLFEGDGLNGWAKTVMWGAKGAFGAFLFFLLAGVFDLSPRTWIASAIWEEMLRYFMVVVAIIVVAVPEGLAMSVTLSLAYGMRRMMAENILVRRLHASETIGAAQIICSDKTGTLTQNVMRVHTALFPGLEKNEAARELIFEGISVNSTAHLSGSANEDPVPIGNPTEGALLLWLHSQGMHYYLIRETFWISRQWTFSAARGFMSTAGRRRTGGEMVLHVKGAPEEILARSGYILTENGLESIAPYRWGISQAIAERQQRGMRLLSLAYSREPLWDDVERVTQNLIWLGFVAIQDPVRPEVADSVAMCRRAGVEVKIVTGDNRLTAVEIARQIGLWEETDREEEKCLSGPVFRELEDREAFDRAREIKILSRAKPLDKLRMVELLKSAGAVVAVTGDGTNDAPALNSASVGLAMGKSGTDMAREAGDIILLDDSLTSIVTAVRWGRSLYVNIQRFLIFQITINVIALGVALLGPILGVKLPLTVIQMLWVNLIMDSFAAMAFATEPPQRNVMDQPPRSSRDFIVSPAMVRMIFPFAGFCVVVFLALLIWFRWADGAMSGRELTVFFTVFILVQFWNMFNVRKFGYPQAAMFGFSENPWFFLIAGIILVGQVLIVQFGGTVFRTVPLAMMDWVWLLSITSPVLLFGMSRAEPKNPHPAFR